jgi:hypothetical protein
MSKYFGDIVEDATIKLPWNTFNSDGASVTVTAVSTDIEVFKDGVILTDPDAGGTVTLNVGTGNGSHLVTIDTNADAEYTTGSDYEVKMAGITIDGQTVNAFVAAFSIENRFMRGTDGANTVVPPTEAQMNARTIPSADYLVEGDTLARVTLVDTVTTNTDKNTLAATDIVTNGAISTDSGSVELVNTVGDGAKDSTVSKEATAAKDATVAKDSTVSKEATSAKDATVSKESTAAKDSTVAKDATVAKEATLDGVATQTTRVDGLIEDSSGDRYTTKALEQAPSGGGGGDATEAKQDQILGNFFPDEVFAPASGTVLYNKKGTLTQLSKKDLKDPAGNAVNSTEDIIAEATEQ